MTEATNVVTGENTISKMIKAKIIQARQTGLFIQVKDIHDKLRADGTNWNSRNMNSETTKVAVDGILAHIQAGGMLPAIVVQARAEGGVQKVDGYQRHEAYKLADASGVGELWVPIVPFTGTELQALAFISTSNKDNKINPLEQLDNYKRIRQQLIDEGNPNPSLQNIADLVQVTRQYVDTILKLDKLDDAGKAMVAEGKVTVAVAVKAVRSDAEGATETLKKAVEKAAEQGKKKANTTTEKKAKPFELGKPLLLDIHQIGLDIRGAIPKTAAAAAEEFLRGDRDGKELIQVPVREVALLLAALREGERQAEVAAKAADAKKQKKAQTDIEDTAPKVDAEPVKRVDTLDEQEAEEQGLPDGGLGHVDDEPLAEVQGAENYEDEDAFGGDVEPEDTFAFLG